MLLLTVICISIKYAEKMKRNQVGEKLAKNLFSPIGSEGTHYFSSDTKFIGIKPTFWS